MVKHMISFSEPQYAFLTRTAKRLGISLAELVRRIVDSHMAANVLILALLLAGCGQSPTSPTMPAALSQRGELTLECDGNICRFSGVAVNNGSGCATAVAGTVQIKVAGESTPRSETPWALAFTDVISPGEFTYRGELSEKLVRAVLPTSWYTFTTFTWHNATCR